MLLSIYQQTCLPLHTHIHTPAAPPSCVPRTPCVFARCARSSHAPPTCPTTPARCSPALYCGETHAKCIQKPHILLAYTTRKKTTLKHRSAKGATRAPQHVRTGWAHSATTAKDCDTTQARNLREPQLHPDHFHEGKHGPMRARTADLSVISRTL